MCDRLVRGGQRPALKSANCCLTPLVGIANICGGVVLAMPPPWAPIASIMALERFDPGTTDEGA